MNDLVSMRSAIEAELTNFVAAENEKLVEVDSELKPVATALGQYILEGGKRIRPIFALIGFIGAGGKIDKNIIKATASLELLQACALIHDDLIDGSDNRRGRPSIHKAFEKYNLDKNGAGNSANFGSAAAILLGDLALVWSDKCIHDSGISAAAQLAVNPIHDAMRIEIMAGQYLDVLEQTMSNTSVERALKIARFKSGKYTIERPLHFGAALATPKNLSEILNIYSDYGLPLGEAFQMRDDLLGVFGDPEETGKPAGDDLREGKRTALIAYSYDRSSDAGKKLLNTLLGKPDLTGSEIESLRTLITDCGAKIHVEDLIEKLAETALDAIEREEITDLAKKLLNEMVSIATKRSK
ncbi:MAG: hypothetical protein RL448_750 [Actinomycetota bacterium]|jgi:geranylgeranyl diphosphate synthase type I